MKTVPRIDFLDRNFKFSTLRSNFSASRLPLRKCCKLKEFFSFIDEKCVPVNFNSIPDPRPNPYEFRIKSRLNCLFSNSTITFSSLRDHVKIETFFGNGSLDALFGNQQKPTHFEWGDYCFDVEKEMQKPLLLTCQPAEALENGRSSFSIVFYLSLILCIITFSIYVVTPELRKRVYHKCFICFMGFVVLTLLLVELRAGSGFWQRGIKFRFISLMCIYYIVMICFCWLHAMCFHMWRTITKMPKATGHSFYAYAVYALGLPAICCTLFFIDLHKTGWGLFVCRYLWGGVKSNPLLLYFIHILAIQQVTNVCLFINVGYLIWYQKQPWNNNDQNDCQKHAGQRKTVISGLIRLSVLTGMDWINISLLCYINSKTNLSNIFYLIYHINLCPGYAIFLTFVCRNEQVIHPLRKKHPKIMKLLEKSTLKPELRRYLPPKSMALLIIHCYATSLSPQYSFKIFSSISSPRLSSVRLN